MGTQVESVVGNNLTLNKLSRLTAVPTSV